MEESNEIIEKENHNRLDNDIKSEKPKRKHKILKRLIIAVSIIVTVILVLGFMFPGLLWTRSLGVGYTKQDYDSFMKKMQYIKDTTPTGNSESAYNYVFGKPVAISTEFTSSELTAFANYNRPSYYAAKNVQIRVNKDGTIEASGKVNVDYVLNEIIGGKFTREQIVKEMPALGILPENVNLYLSIGGSITNNSANIIPNSLSVQGIPIPEKYVKSSESISTVTTGINNYIIKNNAKSGASVEKVVVENEKLVIKGMFPESLTRTLK